MRTRSPTPTLKSLTRTLAAVPLAVALLATACASTRAPEDSAKQDAAEPSTPKPAPKPAPAPEPEPPKDPRVLAESGLGVGGELKPFEIVNSETGERYCQICKFGASPKIMAVGALDDVDFHDDLQNLDAVVKKYEAKQGGETLKAFGVVTVIRDGKSITPLQEREALLEQVKALRATLRVDIPLVVPALQEEGPNKAFDDYYNITKSRTVMFADGRNAVKFSAVAPPDLFQLNQAILEVIGAAKPETAGENKAETESAPEAEPAGS